MHWQALAWPFRTTALFAAGAYVLVATAFTAWAGLNFWLGVMVVTLGAPVWYAVFGGLSLYAEKLFTQAATGLFDEAIDRESELNPFQQGLALKLCTVHLVVFVILFLNGPVLQAWLILPAAVLPFVWIGVLLDESLWGGLTPQRLVRLVSGLGSSTLLAVVLVSGSLGYLHYSLLHAPGVLNLLASPFVFLYGNVLLGVLLYSRRQALNLHTKKSPEQALAATLAEDRRILDKLFHDLQTHMNAGSYATAIAKLEAYVAEDPLDRDPFLHERLREHGDHRVTLEHAVRYLQRLVERDELRRAWTLLKECLVLDDRFRPLTDTALLALTRAAGREDALLVDELLEDFDTAYPESPLLPDARFRRARVQIELLRNGETGLRLLAELARDHPEFAAGEPFQRYRRRLKST
ncbi:MAG: hypothetical protein AB7I04_20270 [Pseudomonadales bacterium]